MAGGLLWGFFLLASFTLSRADTHIRRQQTKKKKKKKARKEILLWSQIRGKYNIVWDVWYYHGNPICVQSQQGHLFSMKKKKKEAEWHEEENWIKSLCFFSHVCIFYMWTCSSDTYSHNMYIFFKKKTKNTFFLIEPRPDPSWTWHNYPTHMLHSVFGASSL